MNNAQRRALDLMLKSADARRKVKGQLYKDWLEGSDDGDRQRASEKLTHEVEVLKRISGKGELGLPERLDFVRLSWWITDGAFEDQPVYDRVMIWQLPIFSVQETGASNLILTENEEKREQESAYRGILIGAGALALDALRSNGMELGYIVSFIRQAPWRMEVDRIDGLPQWILGMRAGDIVASLTLTGKLRDRKTALCFDEKSQQHYYRLDGEDRHPQMPPESMEDY